MLSYTCYIAGVLKIKSSSLIIKGGLKIEGYEIKGLLLVLYTNCVSKEIHSKAHLLNKDYILQICMFLALDHVGHVILFNLCIKTTYVQVIIRPCRWVPKCDLCTTEPLF